MAKKLVDPERLYAGVGRGTAGSVLRSVAAGGRRRGMRGPLGLTRRSTRIATAGFASFRNRVNSNYKDFPDTATVLVTKRGRTASL